MKKAIGLALVFGVLFAARGAAQTSVFVAQLTGANETPNPADPDGVGFVVITINKEAKTLSFTAYVQGIDLPVAASHIHKGAAGVTGPVTIPFNQAFVNGVSSGSFSGLDDSVLADIIANPAGWYFNIHNGAFPGGAVRGQFHAAPGTAVPNKIYVPVTVKALGAKGENFVEDVRIISRAAVSADVTVDFFASNAGGLAGPTSSKVVSVAAGQQLVLNDILGQTFLLGSGIGALRFTTDRDVIVEARILDDRRATNQGQLGFFIHGLGIEAPCRIGTLPVLSQASSADVALGNGLRTNIGYFNPNPNAVSATFTARRTSDGSSLGAVTVAIPGLSHAQFPAFSLISTVAPADQTQTDFYVGYTVASGSGTASPPTGGPLFVYMAVGDNFTGDSYYSAGVCGQ